MSSGTRTLLTSVNYIIMIHAIKFIHSYHSTVELSNLIDLKLGINFNELVTQVYISALAPICYHFLTDHTQGLVQHEDLGEQ